MKKSGNTARVRIPVALMRGANLGIDDDVKVREEGGRTVIGRVRQKRYDLARLLAGITPRNLHAEADLGLERWPTK